MGVLAGYINNLKNDISILVNKPGSEQAVEIAIRVKKEEGNYFIWDANPHGTEIKHDKNGVHFNQNTHGEQS